MNTTTTTLRRSGMIQFLTDRIAWRMGYRRAKPVASSTPDAQTTWDPARISCLAPQVRTCIDVGVGPGTPAFYDAFPDAALLLIEPLEEHRASLERLEKQRGARWLLAAAGAVPGHADITVASHAPTDSSFLPRTDLTRNATATAAATEQRRVNVVTLDQVLQSHQPAPPFALKIDTEGFELQVIRGATKTLAHTPIVIAEVSHAKRFEGGYSFAEFTQVMDQAGYSLRDILEFAGCHPVRYVDAVFVRRAG